MMFHHSTSQLQTPVRQQETTEDRSVESIGAVAMVILIKMPVIRTITRSYKKKVPLLRDQTSSRSEMKLLNYDWGML
jgi:hypothetical protein